MKKYRILIVEDELIVAEDLARLLEESGYEVIGIFDTGEEAVKSALEGAPDLVLVDIQLRGALDGVEAALTIKSHLDPAIVYLTAHSEKGLFERAKATEPDGYLYKPVSSIELKRTVEIVLFKHAMEKRLRESEERYRLIAENANVGILTTTLDGIFLQANPFAAKMAGYDTVEELLTCRADQLYSNPADRQRLMRELLEKGSVSEYEILAKNKDGTPQWISLNAVLQKDHAGTPTSTLGIVQDITDRKKAEEQAQRLAIVANDSNDAITVLALDGTVLDWNLGAERTYGYKTEDALGRSIFELIVPESKRQEVIGLIETIIHGETVKPFETKRVTHAGMILDVWLTVTAIRDESKRIRALATTERDITDLKRAEELLRIEKEQFQTLVENAPFGLVIIDEDGSFRYANPKFFETFGYSLEEVPNGRQWLGKAFPDPDLRREAISAWIGNLEATRPVEQWRRNFTVKCKDGQDKVIHFMRVQLPSGPHLMTCEDITERWQAQERLRQSEEEFRRIIENLQDPFYRADMNGVLTFLSPASERVAGYKPEEGVGQPITLFYADPSERQQFMKLMLENGFVNDFEARLVHKDGHIVWVSTSARLYRDKEGRIAGVEGIARDISERKRAEEALREQESLIRSISDNLPSGMIYQVVRHNDGSRKFTYLSEAVRDFYGCSPDEAMNDPELIYGRVFPEDRYRVFREEEKAHANGSDFSIEARMVNPSGDIRWSHFASSPRRLEDGSTCWSGLEIDITERKRVEEALLHSEAKYRLMFEFSPLGVFHFDETGVITACNDNFVAIIGSSRERLIGLNTIRDLKDAKMIAAIKDALSGGIGHYEGWYSSVTGRKTTPVKCDFAPIVSQDGAVLGGIGIVEDISERKRTEEALRKSETRFQKMMEHSPMAIAVTDTAGNMEYLNKKFVELFGYTLEDIPTVEQWWPLAYPDPQRAALARSDWFSSTRQADENGTEADPREREVRCKDGTIRVVDFRKTVTDKWVIHTLLDVTESKRQKETLREREQMFRLLSEQSLMSVAILQDGIYQYANQAMSDVCEYSVEEILNWGPEQFLEVIHPGDRSLVLEQARMKQTGDPRQEINYAFRIITKSGQTKWVEIYSKTIRFRDRGANLLTMIDITGRKQAEEQLLQSQKMEAIGTLAGGVAHDVNNLLQVILGHADMLLLRGTLDEKSDKSLAAIRGAALNGADLVKRVLTFSRKTEPVKRPLNLSDEVRRVEGLLERTIPRMICLELSLERNLRMIGADPSQIEQILLNLAVNARDAMPEGGRLSFETKNTTIRAHYCRTHPGVKPGKYVLLTVSDTGQGMDKGILDRIFEPFFTTKEPGKGTGLGLSMVFGVVKSHGGHITCYSEAGVGSTFRIYFPVLGEYLLPDLATTSEMPAGGTETLLLVDDEEAVRGLGAEMLELAGYTVLTAANGQEALEVYRTEGASISLVILDLIMPVMSGRKCLEELLKMNPNAKVLIASGYAANGPAKEAREGGAAGFVGKPFDLKEILLAVRKSLDRG